VTGFFHRAIWRFIQVAVCISALFLFLAKSYFSAWVHHDFCSFISQWTSGISILQPWCC
jgi:hypothetical protein